MGGYGVRGFEMLSIRWLRGISQLGCLSLSVATASTSGRGVPASFQEGCGTRGCRQGEDWFVGDLFGMLDVGTGDCGAG